MLVSVATGAEEDALVEFGWDNKHAVGINGLISKVLTSKL